MSATNFHSLLYEYYTAIARFSSDGCAFPRGQKELPPWRRSKQLLIGIDGVRCQQSHAHVAAIQQQDQ